MSNGSGAFQHEIAEEQKYLDRCYSRLDELRELARQRAEQVLSDTIGTTHQALFQRDAFAAHAHQRLSKLSLSDEGLVFGRIDQQEGDAYYIGRIAISDQDQEPLVVDWRAPVAEPFYRATGRESMGIRRRRHLMTRGRRVVGIEDELLDTEAEDDVVLMGEGALMAALARPRTGRMRDIVATIQADQDRIIRAPLEGALVVQGGPGTGKTAVILHRAAYLLYTHRKRLERSGVLIVGPSPVFLRYIELVLPSLGEETTHLATAGTLFPGVRAVDLDPPQVARVKGDPRMAEVIKRAVEACQKPLKKDRLLFYGEWSLKVNVSASRRIISRAKNAKGTHNERRVRVARNLLNHLFTQLRRTIGETAAAEVDRGDFDEMIATQDSFMRMLDEVWPLVTPQELLANLYRHPQLLEEAARGILTEDERKLLTVPEGQDEPLWTEADAALLDESFTHLGPLPGRRTEPRLQEAEDLFLEETIRSLGSLSSDPEVDRMMKELLAERISTRSSDDPEEEEEEGLRTYGHVLVDEAQDLTPMQWRMLGRRCPGGSMTIVGDLGQASRGTAAGGWEEMLSPVTNIRRLELVELAVNYRTPAEIMKFAEPLLRATRPDLTPPTSVRETGATPVVVRAPRDELLDRTVAAVRELDGEEGRVAVVAPVDLVPRLRSVLGHKDDDPLDAPIVVLDVSSVKGLEFDDVIVVEPLAIAEEHADGHSAVYIALTRATRSLLVVHSDELPEPLRDPDVPAVHAS